MKPADPTELGDAFDAFMKYFFLFINPVIHSGTVKGKRLNENRIIVMMALSVCGSVTPGQIAAAFSMQKGSLTSVIQWLVEAGLIKRETVAGDDRSYALKLTEAGKETVKELVERRDAGFERLFADMPQAELRKAIEGVAAMTKHLKTKEVRKC